MPEPVTPADLAEQIADYVAAVAVRDGLFYAWMTGAANGGVNGDGVFPLTDLSGFTRWLESPAKIMAQATTGFAARFATKADMDGSGPGNFIPGTMVLVYGDPDVSKNGPYVRLAGGGWQYAQWFYDSLAQVVQAASTAALADIAAANTAAVAAVNSASSTGLTSISAAVSAAIATFNDLVADAASSAGAAAASEVVVQDLINNFNTNFGSLPSRLATVETATAGLRQLAPESGYSFAITGANGRNAFGITNSGQVDIKKFKPLTVPNTALVSVSYEKFEADARTLMGQQMSPADTGYIYAIQGGGGRLVFGIDRAGQTFIPRFKPSSIPADALVNVTYAKLSSDVTTLMGKAMSAGETGYLYAIQGAGGRMAFGINAAGQVYAPKFKTGPGQILRSMLESSVLAGLPLTFSTGDTGYMFAITDQNNRVGFGVKKDGSIVARINAVSGKFVNESVLTDPMYRKVIPQITDVVEVEPDDWRSRRAIVGTRTLQNGSAWQRMPKTKTTSLFGVNNSGTSLDFRRTGGVKFKGTRYAGTFDIGAVASTRYRGTFSTVAPTASTPLLGDYLEFSSTSPLTFGGDTYVLGDIAVYDGSAWVRQAGPPILGGGTNFRSREPGDFWVVSTSGTFMGVSYTVGERIIYLGFMSQSGTGRGKWTKSDTAIRGDFFYRGEYDPTVAVPSTPVDNDVYQASVAGNAGGYTVAAGDYLVRDGGVWGVFAGDPIKTVASGAFVSLPCYSGDTSEWEVRRTDKSNTRVSVQISGYRQMSPRRNVDKLVLFSDSMFGVSSVGNLILTKTARAGTVLSYGGGTSRDVLTMMEDAIVNQGDPYQAWVHGFWHGQNNQPNVAIPSNIGQIMDASLRMHELIGARDRRCFFMSIMGTRGMIWNGTRIEFNNLEPVFNKTGLLYDLEQWYERTFPGRFFNTRKAQLAGASSTMKDPHLPGMTERQAADMYGVIPFSFYNMFVGNATPLPVPQNSLNFVGYKSDAGLPTGGAANDYYIRTGAGTIGSLIINVAGTWTEWGIGDTIHNSPAGAENLSTAVAAFVNAAYW